MKKCKNSGAEKGGLGVKMGECGSRNLIVRVTRGVQDLQSCFYLFIYFFSNLRMCIPYHGGRYKPKRDFIMLEMQGKYMQ